MSAIDIEIEQVRKSGIVTHVVLGYCVLVSHRYHAPFHTYIIPFIRHTVKGNIGYFATEFLLLNFSHQSHTILETNLVSSSHFSGGSIAHAIEYLVEYFDLLLAQRIFKRYAELVELVRELSSVNVTHTEVVNHINHCKHPFGYFLACCTCLTMFV